MNHPAIVKRHQDAEFTRRYNRLFFFHASGLIPLLVFVVVSLLRCRELVWSAVYASGLSYLLVLLILRVLWRREVLAAMRKDGGIESDYGPPVL